MLRKVKLYMMALLTALSALPLAADSAAAQEPVQLWQQPRISIVWPHDGHGNPTAVGKSRMVNVSVWPSNQVACCQDPGLALLVTKDNEPAEVVQPYGRVQVIERTVKGITFPSVEFNNIPADLVAEPGAKYRFVLMGGSNVWVHAADPRTIFPQQVVPAGFDAAPALPVA